MTSTIADRRPARLLFILIFGFCTVAAWVAPVPRFVLGKLRPLAPMPDVSIPVDEPMTDVSQIMARPLFWESRRPVQPLPVPHATIVVTPEIVPTAGMVLIGVMHSGREASALVMMPTDAMPQELHVGTAIGGLVVQRILSDAIVFGQGKERYILNFPTPGASPLPNLDQRSAPDFVSPQPFPPGWTQFVPPNPPQSPIRP